MEGAPAAAPSDAVTGRCDRPMAIAKVFNCIYYGGYSIFYFYSPLLLRWRGVPANLIGVLLAVRTVVGMLVTPLWTALADALGRHQLFHQLFLVLGSTSRLLYLVTPAAPAPLVAAAVLSEVLTCGMTPLGDTAIVKALKRLDRPTEHYARQRLWGAIGAGWIFMPLAGALLDGRTHTESWAIVLELHISLLVLSACMVSRLWRIGESQGGAEDALGPQPSPPRAPSSDTDAVSRQPDDKPQPAGERRSRGASIVTLLRSVRPTWRGFARCVLFFWCGCFHAATVREDERGLARPCQRAQKQHPQRARLRCALQEGFLFLYLDSLGASALLEGVAILFTCLSEVLIMAVAQSLIVRLTIDGCLVLIFGCYLVRFVAYVALPAMPSLWLVLPAQLLHGITFGLYWTAGATYAAACAPEGLAATFQGAFSALKDGGATLALVAGGVIFGHVGGEGLYRISAMTAACALPLALTLAIDAMARGCRQWCCAADPRLLQADVELSTCTSSRISISTA